MAALTAALMSTVDTLINATAAIFVNDVYRPLMKYFRKSHGDKKTRDKTELFAARLTSIAITAAGVLSVLAFVQFPTVYEAHGYFHSTLTPPLVVAIFMGVFWKRFSSAGVITTFLGGVVLMILGARYPEMLIAPFDHGIEMNPSYPYSYIRALYNLVVCVGVGLFVTYTSSLQNRFITWVRNTNNGQPIMLLITISATIAFFLLVFGITTFELFYPVIVIMFVPLIVIYYGHYDEELATNGLTVWSIAAAKAAFKGSTPNEQLGEKIEVKFKLMDNDFDKVLFSKNDLSRMAAEVGDLVYLSDKRKWLGGLKSIHSEYGEPHDEEGIVYINRDHLDHGLFDEGRSLIAEKEM
jgi:SSS family solute:Na+ symporter